MGKIRAKSLKAKSTVGLRTSAVPMEISKPATPIKSSVSSGRISKSPKKSVSFRSNLTDVVSVEAVANKQLAKYDIKHVPGNKKSAHHESRSFASGKLLKKDIRDKKSRLKTRRIEFMKKIELIKLKAKEEKEAAKRKVVPIVGDTKAMLDALMDVATVAEKPSKKPPPAPKKRFSLKKRQEEIAEGLQYFAAALQHPQ